MKMPASPAFPPKSTSTLIWFMCCVFVLFSLLGTGCTSTKSNTKQTLPKKELTRQELESPLVSEKAKGTSTRYLKHPNLHFKVLHPGTGFQPLTIPLAHQQKLKRAGIFGMYVYKKQGVGSLIVSIIAPLRSKNDASQYIAGVLNTMRKNDKSLRVFAKDILWEKPEKQIKLYTSFFRLHHFSYLKQHVQKDTFPVAVNVQCIMLDKALAQKIVSSFQLPGSSN